MEIEENETLTTLKHKLKALQIEFVAVARIGNEYTLKGEQIERKIDEIQKRIINLKDGEN